MHVLDEIFFKVLNGNFDQPEINVTQSLKRVYTRLNMHAKIMQLVTFMYTVVKYLFYIMSNKSTLFT